MDLIVGDALVQLVWRNQINKTNQTTQLNETDKTDRTDQTTSFSVRCAAIGVELLSFQEGCPGRHLEVSGKSCGPRGLFWSWSGFCA